MYTTERYLVMDIYESLNYVSKLAFPRIKYVWDGLSIKEARPIFRISIFTNKVEDYIEDYYEKGLKSLLKVIECGNLSSEVEFYAKQLLVVLADHTINYHSDICKNKAEIACKLYKKNIVFRETVIEYSPYLYKLIPNLIASSFFHLDYKTVKDVCDNCIDKCRRETKNFEQFLEKLYDEFTYNHSFANLVTEDNVFKYWQIAEYINTSIPELNFYDVRDGKTIFAFKKDIDAINDTRASIKSVKNRKFWINKKDIPEFWEFSFRYPNGVNGDLVRYIFEEYGEAEKQSSSMWRGKISKKYFELFEVFSTITNYITYDPDFFSVFENHHLPTILYRNRYSVTETQQFGKLFYNELMEVLNAHKNEQKQKRTDLYAQLILLDRTSPKWKSEAQLFSLVSSIYPDAIYQYRTDWLGMQSLDIFIPSLSVGIEYQGKQHYSPIEHFGGEEHFKQQQENDKRKKMLCNKNGVILIEWPYTEGITATNLTKFLSEAQSKKEKKANK